MWGLDFDEDAGVFWDGVDGEGYLAGGILFEESFCG
jgi:hypothetical protein